MFLLSMLCVHKIDPSPSQLDALTFDAPTIQRKDCQWLVSGGSASVRCAVCVNYQAVLTVQSKRVQAVAEDTSISSHINYKYLFILHIYFIISVLHRYQPLPNLIQRLEDVKQHCRSVTKKCERLKSKLLIISEAQGISVDNQSHQDLQQVATFQLPYIKYFCLFNR